MLGVSKRTAQLWVESGLLTAWKTRGGHRRITLESVEKLLDDPTSRITRPHATRYKKTRPPQILIAEDEPIFQDLYQTMLPRWSMQPEVQIAANGFDTLVRLGMQRPDVLISDLDMPNMDGFEMLRAIRAMPELKDLAIIVVTALSPKDIELRKGIPADIPVLHKPVKFERLEYMVEAALARLALNRNE